MPVFKYQRITTAGPAGTTLYFRNADTEPRATELAEVEGWRYVFVPETATMPAQPAAIQWQAVALTDAQKEQIKTASRNCLLIAEQMQKTIRDRYSVEDEQYFSRIGVGVALGLYVFDPGEQEALTAFGAHVESVRQWGRDRRAEIGL